MAQPVSSSTGGLQPTSIVNISLPAPGMAVDTMAVIVPLEDDPTAAHTEEMQQQALKERQVKGSAAQTVPGTTRKTRHCWLSYISFDVIIFFAVVWVVFSIADWFSSLLAIDNFYALRPAKSMKGWENLPY